MKNLIIRPHGIGDVVMLIPALRGLIEGNPTEEFVLLTHKGFGQVLPPDLNIKIIELPRHAGFFEMLHVMRQIRAEHFDRVFDLFCNPRTAQISLFSGIKERYGFPHRFRGYAYNHKFEDDRKPGEHIHQVDLYCRFFRTYGLNCEPKLPAVKMPDDVIAKALAAIPEEYRSTKPLIALNVNATYPSKAWPVENAVKFVEHWYEKTKAPVMLTWGPGEDVLPTKIIEKVGHEKAFLHKAVKIKEFVALMSQVNLLVTNDAGPAHMAWEVGTPAVTLFGPTTEFDVQPRGDRYITLRADGIKCARCHKEHCDTKECMFSITPEMVMEAVEKLIIK